MTTTPGPVSAPEKAAAAPAATPVAAAAATPAKAAPAPKAVVEKAAAKLAKAPAAAKAAAAKPAAPAKKAAPKVAAKAPQKAAPQVAAKEEKPKKPKLVRDSFTIPKPEYLVLDEIKQRTQTLARPAKKSEILRAGIKALAALSDTALLAALSAVPTIKTGRPVADKPAAQDKPAKKVRSTKR